jgi:hypothetical protein
MKRSAHMFFSGLLSLLLTSCGGNNGNTVAEGGIGGTGVTAGRVAQVGSVYVNGVHYNTDNATFVINGDNTKSLNDIRVGMVVEVTGSRDNVTATGIAENVSYDSLLNGPVDSIYNATTHHIGVMGQQVHINVDTVFENVDSTDLIASLPLDSLVEVSGFPDAQTGEILATRIELKTLAAPRYKVSGLANNIDQAMLRFDIGGLTIDASGTGDPIPAAGTYISVESNLPPDGPASSPRLFTAESIALIGNGDGIVAEDGESVSIEGVITAGLDGNDLFEMNGQVVDASMTSSAGDVLTLAAGRIVKVDGVMDGTILLAEEITAEASNSEREEISGLLETLPDLTNSTIVLMGQTIHITYSTILENDLGGSHTFSLDELEVGDYVEAKVYDNNGELTASKLEWENEPHSHNAELEGSWSDLGGGLIEILGVTIDPDGITVPASSRIEVDGNYNSVDQELTATSITIPD